MKILFFSYVLTSIMCIYDIIDFGAVPHSDIIGHQFINAQAILNAIKAANATNQQRIIRIPSHTFYSMPIRVQNVNNIDIWILGKLSASKNVKHWPKNPDNKKAFENFFSFYNCSGIQIHGGGKIDGRGYHWWMLLFLDYFGIQKYMPDQSARPHLMYLSNVQNVSIHDIVLKNSPQFHLKMHQTYDVQIYNVAIRVNVTAQFNLLKRFSLEGLMIMFPFNTDGIDPAGSRMHIHNISVQNWDDVVVPKPQSQSECTSNILVENVIVSLGVGMSIGSISPNVKVNCIRNITFRNVYMYKPIKGIYLKSNPGDSGKGKVENIRYENFTMERPLWWAIYLGPQQMKEPNGDGPGCMLYPFDPKGTCSTQPLVDFRNITLDRVKITNSLLYPITIRCNVSNPCLGINFNRVTVDRWDYGQPNKGYICEYAEGTFENCHPDIKCSPNSTDINNLRYSEDNKQETQKQIISAIKQAIKDIPYTDHEDDQFDYELYDFHYPTLS